VIEQVLNEVVGTNYQRLDNLVRAGLIKTPDYPTFKVAIKKMASSKFDTLTPREKRVTTLAMNKILSVILGDDTAYNASLMKLRNEDVQLDVEGVALTEQDIGGINEACDCMKKAKEKLMTKQEKEETIEETDDGAVTPVKSQFTLHFVDANGKKSWKKEESYGPGALKQKYAGDTAPDFTGTGRKLRDIKVNGHSVMNEGLEAIKAIYKDHDDSTLKSLHKVLVAPFKASTGTSINGAQLKELENVENEMTNRKIAFKPFSEPAGKQLSESRLGMPLKGHVYHTKSDNELRYIQKDASEAAQAMKGMDSKAEGKYLDQVNDASTVLHYRKNGGSQVKPSEIHEETVFLEYDTEKYASYFNIGNVYLSDLTPDERMKEIKEAFESKNEEFLIEGSFYGEIMGRIQGVRQQGHTINDVSITSKGGVPHAEFTTTDRDNIIRKHIIHGNSHKVVNQGVSSKKPGKRIDNEKDSYQ